MKLLHCQIALAGAVLVACGAGFVAMNASSEAQRLKTQLADAQRGPATPAPKATDVKPKVARDVEGELRDANMTITRLTNTVKQLQAENSQQKKDLELLRNAVVAASTQTTAPLGTVASAQQNPHLGMPAPPPEVMAPPPQDSQAGSWGTAETSEMNELVGAVKLTPEQTDATRLIIIDSQKEFEDRLKLAQQNNERDIHIIEQIGNEVSKRAQDRIKQILFPEQQQKFVDYMRVKEQAR